MWQVISSDKYHLKNVSSDKFWQMSREKYEILWQECHVKIGTDVTMSHNECHEPIRSVCVYLTAFSDV